MILRKVNKMFWSYMVPS